VPVITEAALQAGAAGCDVLFAPGVTRLAPASVAALKAFVDRGGVLVADAFLATRDSFGEPRPPLSDGLDGLFGVTLEEREGQPVTEGTIGFAATPELSELAKPLPVSLSWYPGGYRISAGAGTAVLAVYSGGTPDRPLPAITVHASGRGKAVLVPRVRLWPSHLDGLRAGKIARPELRSLRMGRTAPDLNGECWALTLRAVLKHLDAVPPARCLRAPVSTAFLDAQAELQAAAGVTATEITVSRYLVRTSQTSGIPYLTRNELINLSRQFGVDLDTLAPVRVNMLQGGTGRAVVAINVSSWGRDAELAVPSDATAAADVLTGESWVVAAGRLALPLGPYQARVLALW
jgi:hypothetical protein